MFRKVPRQLRRIILRDEEEDSHGMEVGVWRLTLRQFYRRDAQGPHVCLGIVSCTGSVIVTWRIQRLSRLPDCLMTSGAIQKGVPTKVFRLLVVLVSCPATPKSASFTSPMSLNNTLAACNSSARCCSHVVCITRPTFMSRCSFFSVCK